VAKSAQGFIGSHVVDRLLEEGYEVTAIDNLSEGHMKNVAHLKDDKWFRFVGWTFPNA